MNRSIMWAQASETGLEHLHISRQKDEIIADGMVLLKEQNVPLRVHYTVRCDTDWHTRQVSLHVVGLAGARQRLISDGKGHWFRAGGSLAAIEGSLDVDINVTPYSSKSIDKY
jgi:hypothetical protein